MIEIKDSKLYISGVRSSSYVPNRSHVEIVTSDGSVVCLGLDILAHVVSVVGHSHNLKIDELYRILDKSERNPS